MPELAILESLGGMGASGILAIIIFLMYRRDSDRRDKRWSERAKEDTDAKNRLSDVLTELIVTVRKANGKT